MTTALPTPLPARLPRGGRWLLGLVVLLPCATGDDRKPMWLLPLRRLTTAILPIVGRATGAAGGGNDLGGGILGNLVSEGHGKTIHGKNKSAMPKIILAISRQRRHITRMSNTTTTAAEETTTCRCCGDYTYSKFTICDECEDNQSAIARGEFHDPDLVARDNEERRWSRRW